MPSGLGIHARRSGPAAAPSTTRSIRPRRRQTPTPTAPMNDHIPPAPPAPAASGEGIPAAPEHAPAATDVAPTDEVAAFRRSILDKLTYMVGKDAAPCAGARLVRRHGAGGARPDRRPLDGRDAPDLPRRPQARLLLLARVPDRPAARRRAGQPGHGGDGARGAARPRRRLRPRCAGSSPTRRSATAASAGSPPASWRAWRRWASPPTATASATTTACSGRR